MHIALRHRFLLVFELAVLVLATVVWLVWSEAVWPIAVVAGAVMVVGWVLGLVGNWRIHRSLSRVRRAAEAIGRGDLSRRVELRPGDEIEKLVRSFNQMADRLERTVSEERELQRQLTRSEKLAVIGELAATVAHEVNNPLDGLQNCSRIIRRSAEDPQRVRHLLDLMDGALYRIEMIVRRLLTLARDETTRLAPGRLDEIVTEAIAFLEPRVGKQGIDLVVRIPDQPVFVVCDRQQMVQVMINLIVNGLDSMSDEGKLTVELATDSRNRLVKIRIGDTGGGIAPEHLAKIFEPFFTTKPGGAGTGLGLAVVKKIVAAHNGHVRVDSKVGVGTTLTIELPVISANEAAAVHGQPAEVR